jgi:Bacteriophage HK97-gp10, putative tail-component
MAKSFKVNVLGLDNVLKRLEETGGQQTVGDLEKITETYARKMASESAEMAPVDTGALKNSISSSPQKAEGEGIAWEWGSNLPYATRQEYEHKSKKGFVRKAIWNNRTKYREAIRNRITKG